MVVDGGAVDWPALVVHGGAGPYTRLTTDPGLAGRLSGALDAALDAGWAVLEAGGSALDAAVAAVRFMEDDGAFNAGRGSVPTTGGSVEMDACVMDDTGRAGAVTCLSGHSAVAAARAVWAEPPGEAQPGGRTVLLAGAGAEAFAAGAGVSELVPIHRAARPGVADPAPLSPEGTVGAVAVTADGRFAGATSTGGRAGQPPGRVGDSPIPGAGVWAEPGCAVSATGAGEAFILAGFSRLVATGRSRGLTLDESIRRALAEVARYGGDGGGIALARDRTWVGAFDTRAMARGVRHRGGKRVTVGDPPGPRSGGRL